MALYWYVAPVCTVDSDTEGYHPGEGDGSTCPGVIPGLARIHAYDPDPDTEPPGVPTTCLVGASTEQTRDGWTSKTLAEAQTHFESFYGVAPSADEVY
jgi:hypothetical protein